MPWGLSPPELRTVLLYFMAAGPTDLLRWARVRERAWRDGGRRFLNGRNGGGRYKLDRQIGAHPSSWASIQLAKIRL